METLKKILDDTMLGDVQHSNALSLQYAESKLLAVEFVRAIIISNKCICPLFQFTGVFQDTKYLTFKRLVYQSKLRSCF